MATRKDPLPEATRVEADEVWSKYDYDNFLAVNNEMKDMSRLIEDSVTK